MRIVRSRPAEDVRPGQRIESVYGREPTLGPLDVLEVTIGSDEVALACLPPGSASSRRIIRRYKVGEEVTVLADEATVAEYSRRILEAIAGDRSAVDGVTGSVVRLGEGWMWEVPAARRADGDTGTAACSGEDAPAAAG